MKSKVVEFDTPEAAHQAAWMLYGQYIKECKVAIPPCNANSETLNAVAAQVGSRWRWVVVSEKTIRLTISEWIFDYFYHLVDAEAIDPIIKIHIFFSFSASMHIT